MQFTQTWIYLYIFVVIILYYIVLYFIVLLNIQSNQIYSDTFKISHIILAISN